MATEHSTAVSKLSRRAKTAYSKAKQREAEVRTGGVPNGVSKPGIAGGVAVLTDVRSGVSEKTGDPWFSFAFSVLEEKAGEGACEISGQRFSVLNFIGETEFSSEDDAIDDFVNNLKLMGYDKEVRAAKDVGSAVETILPDLKEKRPMILFNSSTRASARDKTYRCFIAGLTENGYQPPGDLGETTSKPAPKKKSTKPEKPDENVFTAGTRVSVEYDGKLYDGTVTAINEDKGTATVAFDDDTVDEVPIEELSEPTT